MVFYIPIRKPLLRPIYTAQLCRMRYAYDKSRTRVVSCKSSLQLAYDCRVRHEECRGLFKHVLKPCDNRSDRQFEIVYDFSLTRAARAIKIACDNRKQKSYRVNRPLRTVPPIVSAHPFCASRETLPRARPRVSPDAYSMLTSICKKYTLQRAVC